ncbi:MAG: DUF2935 domain-containing protein [Clostridiales bacterium]|nr:DUF2935 domain-containing protein [Clostridiales bacterium]
MEKNQRYVVQSIELHLFFARIMKEHSLFLEAGFTPAEKACAEKAEHYKEEFEKLLMRAVRLGDGLIRPQVLHSGEIVTEFTQCAEQQTERLTGISIDEKITELECQLKCTTSPRITPQLVRQVRSLNQDSLPLVNGLICLKEEILKEVAAGRMFTVNYPLLIEHILREAKLYRSFIAALENGRTLTCQEMRNTEQFWNRIMMEHALFIRGLLDPCETELIDASDDFAEKYCRLLEKCRERESDALREQSLQETCKFRDFKAAGTKGIQDCKIRSIILPLLADHVLREANHYIGLLEE